MYLISGRTSHICEQGCIDGALGAQVMMVWSMGRRPRSRSPVFFSWLACRRSWFGSLCWFCFSVFACGFWPATWPATWHLHTHTQHPRPGALSCALCVSWFLGPSRPGSYLYRMCPPSCRALVWVVGLGLMSMSTAAVHPSPERTTSGFNE